MDLKEIKQIVDLMKRSDLTEFEIEEEGLKLRICRDKGDKPIAIAAGGMQTIPIAPVGAGAPPAPAPVAPPVEDATKLIKSPMVGTFYAAPSPDNPVYVGVGDTVKPDTVVCIVEAMKVMNEIKAETSGVIAEICVNNGDSVEYGQPLFKLK